VTGFGGGVQQFGHPAPGTAVAGGVGFAAESAPQFHLDLGSLALGDTVEEGVLVAGWQVLDPSGQLARIVFRLCQGRARLGRDREQVGVEAEEVGQRALWCGEHSQAGGHRWFELLLFVVVEGVLVAFPGSVGCQPGQVKGTQVPGGEFGADARDGRQGILGVFDPVSAIVFTGQIENEVFAGLG